jgi:hypothetical protein
MIYLFIQLALTFARAITNQETQIAYERIFKELFNIIEDDNKSKFKFRHIDGEGLGCVVADAHKGQALGNFLLIIFYKNDKIFP